MGDSIIWIESSRKSNLRQLSTLCPPTHILQVTLSLYYASFSYSFYHFPPFCIILSFIMFTVYYPFRSLLECEPQRKNSCCSFYWQYPKCLKQYLTHSRCSVSICWMNEWMKQSKWNVSQNMFGSANFWGVMLGILYVSIKVLIIASNFNSKQFRLCLFPFPSSVLERQGLGFVDVIHTEDMQTPLPPAFFQLCDTLDNIVATEHCIYIRRKGRKRAQRSSPMVTSLASLYFTHSLQVQEFIHCISLRIM